jgi:molybdate transport system permease protein
MNFAPGDFVAFFTTFKLASITTVFLLILGTPLAWWLAHTRCRCKPFIEAVVALPIVLPPTVLGFYMLVALGSNGPLGSLELAFTFTGLVIGSIFYSLPFVVQPLQSSFSQIGARPMEVAASLGASPLDSFFSVAVPMARRGFLTATVLGFAHTVGEFGVVLMIGGNIPGKTRVLSIAIYDHVEALEYGQAHVLSAILLMFAFLVLFVVYYYNRRAEQA